MQCSTFTLSLSSFPHDVVLNILPGSDKPVPSGFAVCLSEKSSALADIKDD